jgi:hypothetical protein
MKKVDAKSIELFNAEVELSKEQATETEGGKRGATAGRYHYQDAGEDSLDICVDW